LDDENAPGAPVEDDPADDARVRVARRQAANYRARMRAAEAERDHQAARVAELERVLTVFRTRDVERVAGALPRTLADVQDLWRDGTQLDDLIAEDGTVDVDAVNAAVEATLQRHPHWSEHRLASGFDGGPRGAGLASSPDVASLLRGIANPA
jgi:hypothetical protein